MTEVVGYAFVLGLVGLVNPCGFPLLPAYLSLFVGDLDRSWRDRLWSALRAGGCVTGGFLVVFGALGLVAGSLSAAVSTVAPWLMIGVGLAIAVFGAAAVFGRGPVLHLATPSFRAGRGAVAMLGFGVAYAIGSLSCSLPIFLAGVGSAFSSASFATGLAAFVAYGLGMGLFVTAASVVAAFAGSAALRALRPASAVLPRVAGVVCLLVGVYLVGYWTYAIWAPAPLAWLVVDVDRVQAAVAAWCGASWLPVAIVCALVVGGTAVAATMGGRRGGRQLDGGETR